MNKLSIMSNNVKPNITVNFLRRRGGMRTRSNRYSDTIHVRVGSLISATADAQDCNI